MPEYDRPGTLIIGIRATKDAEVIARPGNNADIEATKRQARSLVAGPDPICSQVWIVDTRWEATPDNPEGKS